MGHHATTQHGRVGHLMGPPQLHAVVPEMGAAKMGAADAWHAAATELEDLQLADIPCCGAVADFARFFDQIIRDIVYAIAAYAGMPRKVLAAYRTTSNT